MGSGIAQVAALSGFDTIIYDLNGGMLTSAAQKMQNDLEALTAKGRLTAGLKDEALSRLHYSDSPADCIADVIIEAIVEKIEIKVELFRELARYNPANTIFATNTSSLSVTAIAEQLPDPSRVAGMHFFNPAPVMKLVEIVKGEKSDEKVI